MLDKLNVEIYLEFKNYSDIDQHVSTGHQDLIYVFFLLRIDKGSRSPSYLHYWLYRRDYI